MNPEVSVIIPTYNSEDYIAQALESVFSQTYTNLEIIVIDDASQDSTVDIVRSFGDSRLKILRNKRNRGVSYGRNLGIKHAKGRWIALLDSDDWYAPSRLEHLLSVASTRGADLVADNLLLIREQEYQPWSTLLDENKEATSSVRLINAAEFVVSDRLSPLNAERNWSLGYSKPLIRREFLLKNKIQYNEKINIGEDFSIYLDCLRHKGRFYLVPQAYYYYRTRTSSLSTRTPLDYLTQSCTITQSFIDQEVYFPTSSRLLSALNQNLDVFERRIAYFILLENIKGKKIREVYQQLLLKPYVLSDILCKLIYVIQSRISSRLDFSCLHRKNIEVFYLQNQTLSSDISKVA